MLLSTAALRRSAGMPLTTASRLSSARQLSTSTTAAARHVTRTIPNNRPLAPAATFTQFSAFPASRVPRLDALAPLALPSSIRTFARRPRDSRDAGSNASSSSSSSSSPNPGKQDPATNPPSSSASSAPSASSSSPSSSPSPDTPKPPPSSQSQNQNVAPDDDYRTPDLSEPTRNPFDNLPDLTRGIPSTFEYEQSQAKAQARNALTEAYGDEEGAPGGRDRGELPDSAYVSSSDRRRQALIRRLLIFSGVFTVASVTYMGRDWETTEEAEKHPNIPNGWGPKEWWDRLRTRLSETLTYYHEPAFEKLLPDPDPQFARPYTLVIGLEDVLVHGEWTREHGWRLAKRPGMDYFIRYLSQYFELVLFTATPFGIVDPTIRKIDPYHFMLPLFREATKWKDGEMVKDLSYLNRDLSKVIIVDCNEKFVRNQPENAIILPKWTGDPADTELIALIPFLEYIFAVQSPDVRKVLKSFEGKHIPTEFARREAIARTEFNKRRTTAKGRLSGGVGSRFGVKQAHLPDGEQDPAEAFAQGKMLQDIVRERGQRMYEVIDKEIKENGEKLLKEEQALQEKAQKEAMSDMMGSVKGYIPFIGAPKEENNSPSDKKA